jgi:hypothetical protein
MAEEHPVGVRDRLLAQGNCPRAGEAVAGVTQALDDRARAAPRLGVDDRVRERKLRELERERVLDVAERDVGVIDQRRSVARMAAASWASVSVPASSCVARTMPPRYANTTVGQKLTR